MSYISYDDTITVNGVSLFYHVEGCGKPVILLHGNGGSHRDLMTMVHQLAMAGYAVYAIDSRGQGNNAPLDEYHYADMAEDVFQFIERKGLDHPAVYGWSDGGIVALELELYNPGTVSVMAVSGSNLSPDGVTPECYRDTMCIENPTPLVKMMQTEPNIDPSRLERVKCPVLVTAGEWDLIAEDHTRLIANSLPQGELLIVPGGDHGNYIYQNYQMGMYLLSFLKKHGY